MTSTKRPTNLLAALAGAALIIPILGCGSDNGPRTYTQFDRLARPAVNELFATVAGNRHQTNDQDRPIDDASQLATDIQSFMANVAGRRQDHIDVVKAVLVPDVMIADMSQANSLGAGYLGVETGGKVGTKFGGRALTDDIIDTSVFVVFGNALSVLGFVPSDDGKEIPTLASGDNVSASGKHFTLNAFPYLGPPT